MPAKSSALSGEREQAVTIPKQSAITRTIDAMQYYSIAMVVMFSIMTAFALIHGIVEETAAHVIQNQINACFTYPVCGG